MKNRFFLIFIFLGCMIFFIFYNGKHKQNEVSESNKLTQIQTMNEIDLKNHNNEDVEVHEDEEHLGHEYSHDHTLNESTVKDYTNKQASNFKLKTLKGYEFTLSQLRGKKVLLNFWTTWCPPCQEEMPQIEEYYKEYGKQHNMEVVAINITDQDSGIDVIKEFAEYYHLTFPIALDEKGEVSKKYGIVTIPTSFVIDEKGNITKEIIGPVTKEKLIEYFK